MKTPSIYSEMGSPVLCQIHSDRAITQKCPGYILLFRAWSSGPIPCLLLAVVPNVFCCPFVCLIIVFSLPTLFSSFLINIPHLGYALNKNEDATM